MEKETRESLVKIIAAALMLAGCIAVERLCPSLDKWQLLLFYLVPYLTVGWETLREGAEKLLEGEALDEDFLMGVATVGALAVGFLPGAGTQFPEAVFVMLFFQLGELFEGIAEGRSRRSIAALMDIRPDTAFLETPEGVQSVNPSDVAPGDVVVVRPGGRVPLDGIVIEGASSLDTAALTGESVPRDVAEGDAIVSGCVNLSGLLRIRVTKAFGESTASRILDLVENAAGNKSRSESFISRFARVYTPVVVGAAVLLAVVPLFFGGAPSVWIYRALTFLIVSCPCALVISVPLSFFGGIGAASRRGVLIKGSNYLEALARLDTVVFDKTGTLTEGVFEVSAVHPGITDGRQLLHLAAHVERHSTHPIALSLRAAYPGEDDACKVSDISETAGRGVCATVNGSRVCVGNAAMLEAEGVVAPECREGHHTGTVVHVLIDGTYAGHIVISDRIKASAPTAVKQLRQAGVRRLDMLTGDSSEVAATVAGTLGLDGWKASLLPADKLSEFGRIKEEAFGAVAFVGDGMNDAPVLAGADVGIAMGALGSDAAIEAADVVLMDDDPGKIAVAVRIARRTLRIAGENTSFAIGVKLAVLGLAAFGLAPMWLAVFADVGVTVLAVLNAMRTM